MKIGQVPRMVHMVSGHGAGALQIGGSVGAGEGRRHQKRIYNFELFRMVKVGIDYIRGSDSEKPQKIGYSK